MRSNFSRFLDKVRTIPAGISRWPKWVRWIAFVVVLIVIGLGGFYFVKARQTQTTAAQQPALQTAITRQGNLILRASGTGTLIAASQVNIGFPSSGKLKTLNVKVGDKVEAGQLLAQLDDSSLQTQLAQAKQTLLDLTSPVGIATAEQNVVAAEATVQTTQKKLQLLISPAVQIWEERLVQRQQDLLIAQNEAGANPSTAVQKKINDAQLLVKLAQANLFTAHSDYPTYLLDNFALTTTDARTGVVSIVYETDPVTGAQTNIPIIYAPTENQIATARAAYALANASLVEAQNYAAALNGTEVPSDATGTALAQFNQAKLNVQTAQDNLDATQLYAPISGTVMAISNQVGESVASGTFMTIADLSQADIQIYMDQNDWNNIKIGYEADVTFDALPDQIFVGKVMQVSPQLVTVQGSSIVEGLVQLDLKQASGADPLQLPLGVSASVDVIAAKATNAILVPVQALHLLSPGSYAVFVMTGGKPTLRIVTVGIQDATYAEIKTGLQAGEVVSTGIQATTSNSQSTTP